jgi:hypothetical protein
MINHLTAEQESQIEKYRNKWISIGRHYEPEINIEEASKAVDLLYECGGLKPPTTKIFVRGILDGMAALALIKQGVEPEEVNQKRIDAARKNKKLMQSVLELTGDAFFGQHDSNWISFYEYFRDVLKVKIDRNIEGMIQTAKTCGWVWVYDTFVVISAKPIAVRIDNKVIHSSDGTPAIEYADGLKVYAYEGVRIPEKYGKVPVDLWDPQWILKESNADIRTKLLKGIGYERFIQSLQLEPVDKLNLIVKNYEYVDLENEESSIIERETILPYELLTTEILGLGIMKFLKMKNPSVPGVYHIEPVAPHPWIKTCEDALRWRVLGDIAKDKSIKIDYNAIK